MYQAPLKFSTCAIPLAQHATQLSFVKSPQEEERFQSSLCGLIVIFHFLHQVTLLQLYTFQKKYQYHSFVLILQLKKPEEQIINNSEKILVVISFWLMINNAAMCSEQLI